MEEDIRRAGIWAHNDIFIRMHNANPLHSFVLGHNQFSDLTHDEFRAHYLSTLLVVAEPRKADMHVASDVALPESMDWRNKGAVSGVKNQGQCGSCWAFSATGSLESQHFLKTGNMTLLSEQNLVDCSGPQGNKGCAGGWMNSAFTYIQANKGIDTEASYPYTAMDGSCKFSPDHVGATCTGFKNIASKNETDLLNAVATVGPVSVAIDASHGSFQFYKSGVYDPFFCSQTRLDHGVLAVGYGNENGKNYWLVKNSWGAQWGNAGYIMMVRNKNNHCGIATAASYPTV